MQAAHFIAVAAAAAVIAVMVPPPAHAKDADQARAERRKMCDEALAALYKDKPELKARVASAAGYGCFSSFGVSFFLGGAGGAGLVHDNRTKKNTYMNMGQATGGVDFGIKDYREVLVFKDAKALNDFVTKGWETGGGATASAAVQGKGAEAAKMEMTSGPIEVFTMNRNGLQAGISAGARKYWKSDELNK
jgi:lipid-binding SYLF domain-containing protein